MKTFGTTLALTLVSGLMGASALAYQDGTYTCKNGKDLSPSVYKIESVAVRTGGPSVPYVDITSSYKDVDTNKVVQIHVSGFAVVGDSGDSQYLLLGNLNLEFTGNSLLNCDKTSRR